MSKWGFVSQASATSKFENAPKETAEMVTEMSMHILEQEKEIHQLKDDLIKARMTEGGAKAEAAHLRGYVERVRGLDPKDTHDSERSTLEQIAKIVRREPE